MKKKQDEIKLNIKANINDAMLKDDREREEPKEIKKVPKVTKGQMEDIKEQDSEQESVQQIKKEAPPVIQVPQTPAADNEQVQAKLKNLTEKKQKLQAQLARMKDSKSMMDLKKESIPAKPSGGASKQKKDEFKLYHLIMISVLGLLVGAFLQLKIY